MGLGLFAHIRVRIDAFFIRSEMKSWKRRSFLSRQSSQFARAADSRARLGLAKAPRPSHASSLADAAAPAPPPFSR